MNQHNDPKKPNIEEQITSMLDKVLSDNEDDDYYSDENEPSFICENQDRLLNSKRIQTSKNPDYKQRMKAQYPIGGVSDPNRMEKKFPTAPKLIPEMQYPHHILGNTITSSNNIPSKRLSPSHPLINASNDMSFPKRNYLPYQFPQSFSGNMSTHYDSTYNDYRSQYNMPLFNYNNINSIRSNLTYGDLMYNQRGQSSNNFFPSSFETPTPLNLSTTSPNVSPMMKSYQIRPDIFNELEAIIAKIDKIDYFLYSRLEGKFISIIRTQKGSRIFQNYLKNTPPDIIHSIFNELCESLDSLLADVYANYFCQKIFNHIDSNDRLIFLDKISKNLFHLSINKTATYPIQAIVEQLISRNEKEIVTNALKDYINTLAFDIYGTHVVEKMISCFEEDLNEFIYEFVLKYFVQLANNSNGLCIIKKVLIMSNVLKINHRLKEILSLNLYALIQNPYGNYAIQYWKEKDLLPIMNQFAGNYTNLSMQKFSSNVIERSIEKNKKCLRDFITEIINNDSLADLMKNNYGNYVIQKVLKLTNGTEKAYLVENIIKSLSKISDNKIYKKWRNIIQIHLDTNFITSELNLLDQFDKSMNIDKV